MPSSGQQECPSTLLSGEISDSFFLLRLFNFLSFFDDDDELSL